MPNFYTRLFARIAVYQAGRRPELDYLKETGAGNILDLPSRHVMSTELGAESVDTVGSSDGTQIPTGRSHVAEIPITEEEVGRLAELMNRVGCYCQFTALGLSETKHLRWAEPSRMTVEDRSNGPLQYAPKVLRFECDVFHPNIVQSQNLIEQVPFEGANSRAKNVREIDAFTVEQGTDNAYAFQYSDGFFYSYEPFNFGTFQKPDDITYFNEDVFYFEAGGSAQVGGDSAITVSGDYLVGDMRKSDGVFDFYYETDYVHQGIAVIAAGNGTRAGNLIYWVPGDGQFFETDDLNNISQKWTVSEFTQIQACTYDFNGVSDERGILVLDVDGNVYSLSLAPNSDSYSVTDTYNPTNPFDVSSKTGWNYFTVVQNEDIFPNDITQADVRDNDIDRYDQSDGSLVETTDLQQYVLRQRGVGERKGYEGERFSAPNQNVTVGIAGTINNLDTAGGEELVTDIIYPFPYTTIEADDLTGVLEAYDWEDTLIGTAPVSADPADDPVITIDGDLASRVGFQESVWKLRLRLQSTAGSPKLRVIDPRPGRALGARPGGWVDDCIVRVDTVGWSPSTFDMKIETQGSDAPVKLDFEDLQGDKADNVSVDWGDGTRDKSTPWANDYSGSLQEYNIVIFARPDFSNIDYFKISTRDATKYLDTWDFSEMKQLTKLVINEDGRNYNPGRIGSLSFGSAPPNCEVFDFGVNKIQTDVDYFPPSTLRILSDFTTINGTPSDIRWDKDAIEILEALNSSFGTLDQNHFGQELIRFHYSGKVDLVDLADVCPNLNSVKFIRCNTAAGTDTLRYFLVNVQDGIEGGGVEFKNDSSDLTGSNVIPPNSTDWASDGRTDLVAPPDDLDHMNNAVDWFVDWNVSSGGNRAPDKGGRFADGNLDPAIQNLWSDRANYQYPHRFSIRESVASSDETNRYRLGATSTYTGGVDYLLGLGENSGTAEDGLVDYFDVFARNIFTFEVLSVSGDTLTLDFPVGSGYYRINNSKAQVLSVTDDGSGGTTDTWFDIFLTGSSKKFRVKGDGGANLGVYEFNGENSGNGYMVITAASSLDSNIASGDQCLIGMELYPVRTQAM